MRSLSLRKVTSADNLGLGKQLRTASVSAFLNRRVLACGRDHSRDHRVPVETTTVNALKAGVRERVWVTSRAPSIRLVAGLGSPAIETAFAMKVWVHTAGRAVILNGCPSAVGR